MVRFPLVVAVAALTTVAGLAAAAAPLALDVPILDVATPSGTLSPLASVTHEVAALDAVPIPSAGTASHPLALSVVRVDPAPAVEAPAMPAPVDAPILLLPDGLAMLPAGATESVSAFSFSPSVPNSGPSQPSPPILVTSMAPQTPVPSARVGPIAPVPDASGPGMAEASDQAHVVSPAARAAAYAAGGAAVGIVGLLGVALYHRIRPHATLENDTRKLIFEAVCESPGLGVHVIAERARVSYSTATYHLERLIAAGMIVMTPDGNKLCYYKNGGAFTESERKILPLVKNEEAAKLLEAILDTPGTYRAALAERLGVTATTINWHLRRLREAGLIEETRQGRNAYLFVRVASAKESFLSLASKVDVTDAPVAERLRKFAHFPSSHGASSGA